MTRHKRLIGAGLVLLLAVCAVAVAGAFTPGGAPKALAEDTPALTLELKNGGVREYSLEEVQALPVYSGYAGMLNSYGTVTKPVPVEGVRLTDLFADAGGILEGDGCEVVASDGYKMSLSYRRSVGGDFPMYSAMTKQQEPPVLQPVAVLVYKWNGSALDPDKGPLRLAICQDEDTGQVADSHWFVSDVVRVRVTEPIVDWSVKVVGLKRNSRPRLTSTLTSDEYESCSTCHNRAWTSANDHEWTGVNLSYIIASVDGGISAHSDDAFNVLLAADGGYRIRLYNDAGKYVTISSRTMARSKRVMLADKRDGLELGRAQSPLRLVGPYLDSSKFISRITKIVMVPK